jgi:hypothetical protein
MALNGSHIFDPVGARGAGHVAREAKWKRGGLLSVFIRDGISVFDMANRG